MFAYPLWAIFAAVWFLLYGLFHVTNFRVDFGDTILGMVAILVAVFLFLELVLWRRRV